MEQPDASVTGFRFGSYEVDLRAGELRRNGRKVRLQEQPFRILVLLLQRPGELITRDALREELWPDGTFVDFDHGLNNAVNRLREALGDSAETLRLIETLPRRGYRFTATMETLRSRPETIAPGGRRLLRVRGRRALALAALGLVLAGIVAWAVRRREGPEPASRGIMLAVLPFENLSGDPQQDYFSDGLTEGMIAELGRLQPSRLAVIARPSAMRYKRTTKRADQIGRELAADYLLRGTVRRTGERVRIGAELVRVATQGRVWSATYERDLRDVASLQAEVARAMASEVNLELTPVEQARLAGARPVDPEAHELYLKGRYQLNKRTEQGLREGLDLFQRAIETSPRYAPAHAGLADSYLLLGAGAFGFVPPQVAMPKAKAAARRALELDGNLAPAHATLAFVAYVYDWDWAAAEKGFRRAIELDPNYATAHHWYSLYLKSMGRRDETLSESTRALALDPLSLTIEADRAWSLFHLREFDQAIDHCRKVVAVDPRFALAHRHMGLAYVLKGDHAAGVRELEEAARLSDRAPVYVAALGYAHAVARHVPEARKLLAELQVQGKYVSPADIARLHLGLGETDEAFRWLEKAYEERSDVFVNFKVDPRLDPLRSDPRFVDLSRRVGLSATTVESASR